MQQETDITDRFPGLRTYQQHVLDRAKTGCIIAFLPTGAGKTLIAVGLIRDRLVIQRRRAVQRRAIAFVVPTKVLVEQQSSYVRSMLPVTVHSYTGCSTSKEGVLIDHWRKADWEREFQITDVLVLTPELLRQALQHELITAGLLDTVILDECHHASGNHPMAKVCHLIWEQSSSTNYVHIFGMTASPLTGGQKVKGTAAKMKKLEETTRCKIVSPLTRFMNEVLEATPRPELKMLMYTSKPAPFQKQTADLISQVHYAYAELPPKVQLGQTSIGLLHAYLRLRQASQLSDIRRAFRTAGHPDVGILSALEDGDTNKGFSSQLAPLEQLLGLLLRTAESCGVLCALYSLSAAFSNDKRSSASISIESYTSYRPTSVIDLEKEKAALNAILQGPFGDPLQLADLKRMTILSFLEALCCLASVFDLTCRNAAADRVELDEQLANWWVSDVVVHILRHTDAPSITYHRGCEGILSAGILSALRDVPGTSYDPGDWLRQLKRTVFGTCQALLESFDDRSLAALVFPPSVCSTDTCATLCVDVPAWIPSEQKSPEDAGSGQRYDLVTGKIQILCRFLVAFARERVVEDPSWAGMLFCDTRLNAVALCSFVSRIANLPNAQQGRPLIRPKVLIGGSSTSTVSNNRQSQNEVMTEFRNGTCNLLMTTTVAEEGLDIRKCQLVINFDHPATLKSFVQRRGRARSRNSLFICLVSRTHAKLANEQLQALQAYKQQEKDMLDMCGDDSNDDDCGNTQGGLTLPPSHVFRPPGVNAQVDVYSAVQLLYTYCQKLPGDNMYRPAPTFYIDTQEQTEGVAFSCRIVLPHCVPESARSGESGNERRKLIAKGSAALDCIRKLYHAGELNAILLPKDMSKRTCVQDQHSPSTSSDDTVLIDDSDDNSTPASSSDNTIDQEVKIMPSCWLNNDVQCPTMWFYKICVRPAVVGDVSADHLTYCKICENHIRAIESTGLAVRSLLPMELQQPIEHSFSCREHVEPMQIELTMQLICEYEANAEELSEIHAFHSCMADMMCDQPSFSRPRAYCWLQELLARNDRGYYILLLPVPLIEGEREVLPREEWLSFFRECVHTVEFLQGQMSVPPTMRTSSEAIDITEADIPLISPSSERRKIFVLPDFPCKHLDAIEVHIQQDGASRLVQSSRPWLKEDRASELELSPESACWAHAIFCIPPLIWLVSSLALAQEARSTIIDAINALNLPLLTTSVTQTVLCDRELHIEDYVPSVESIMCALTSKQASETHDFQRFKFIGDSFLNMATSVLAFVLLWDRHEGILSAFKEEIISDKNLEQVANKAGLSAYIRSLPLCCAKLDSSVISKSEREGFVIHRVQRELFADAVKALVGIFVFCKGEGCGLVVLQALDVWAHALSGKTHSSLPSVPIGTHCAAPLPNVLQIMMSIAQATHEQLLGAANPEGYSIGSLEEALGYQFRVSSFVAIAVTHCSYEEEESNQRLKFLGNSVLDFVVVKHLFQTNPNADLEQLTQLRSVATSIATLSKVMIARELYRSMKHMCEKLANLCVQFESQATQPGMCSSACYQVSDSVCISDQLECVPLANMMEALIGAVYLDSEGSLEVVERVVFGLGILPANIHCPSSPC